MPSTGFGGVRVLSLESRRAKEIAQLIQNNGGQPLVAPSTREVPEGPNPDELSFASQLLAGRFRVVIFMTGVGTRHLAEAIESVCPRDQFVEALRRTKVVARGPKPIAVLREFGVPVAVNVLEPNTWREILHSLDENSATIPLQGQTVAVQEHGVPVPEFYEGLRKRGAQVFPVHVYKWEPPEDTGPLRAAIESVTRREINVLLFTASVQVHHWFRFVDEMHLREPLVRGLEEAVIASIGPSTSETLREHGLHVDLEASHPKMGILVKECAERSAELLQQKRRG